VNRRREHLQYVLRVPPVEGGAGVTCNMTLVQILKAMLAHSRLAPRRAA
jgi:hypothetical protein